MKRSPSTPTTPDDAELNTTLAEMDAFFAPARDALISLWNAVEVHSALYDEEHGSLIVYAGTARSTIAVKRGDIPAQIQAMCKIEKTLAVARRCPDGTYGVHFFCPEWSYKVPLTAVTFPVID